ncbi:MAG: type II secretion system protein [Pseudomonadota bacterium]
MKHLKKNQGFTLIELLLVVVIIGLMLAVIVPRAWRANIDTKYGLVRQAASELASFGHEWAEGQLAAQPESATSTALNYFYTLAGGTGAAASGQQWVPAPAGNWVGAAYAWKVTAPETPIGRTLAPEITVAGIVTPEKHPRNPFNGASYFTQGNDPGAGSLTPGAIACCQIDEGGAGGNWHYFAFLFQGTDSTTTGLAVTTTYYAGQDPTILAGLRNGMFLVRSR